MKTHKENGKETGNPGYGNPPVEHQFKKGNPGGPGRPKGSLSLARLIKEELWKDNARGAKQIAWTLVIDARDDLKTLKFVLEQLESIDADLIPPEPEIPLA